MRKMGLTAGAIAGIAIASALFVAAATGIIFYIVKKQRERREYEEKCGKLWKKYTQDVVGTQPPPEAQFLNTPVAWQQFTPGELNMTSSADFTLPLRPRSASDRDQRLMATMSDPINPGDINPRLYASDNADESLLSPAEKKPPQLFYSLEFDEELSILKIGIDQARNLRPRTLAGTCDPYCVVKLEPGHVEKKTKVIHGCVDPLFQENFSFEITKKQMQEKVLKIKVFDFDQFSRHECTGVVLQNLNDIQRRSKVDIWKKIVPTAESEQLREKAGDLLLRLAYLRTAGKLTVVLLKARNLNQVGVEDDEKQPDPYIRVTIIHDGNMLKKKKTSTRRKTVNPTYNQAINFAVPVDMLPQIEIQFHIVHDFGVKTIRGSRKEVIGYLEIGPHSRGDEYEHWKDLMTDKPQARWHHLTVAHDGDHGTIE